jgi:hypothetical protein
MTQWDVGDVNGMIANDKFCMIRKGRLQLRWCASYPLCYHARHTSQPESRYTPDERAHSGGEDETQLESQPTVSDTS